VLSDVHGNPFALDAVLADAGDVDAYWVLGDLAALGPDPVGAVERLAALPNASFTGGNADRYVTTTDLPGPPVAEAIGNAEIVPRLIESAGSFGWTRGCLTAKGWFDWLAGLPLDVRTTLPDGTRVLGVHASPGRDDGPGLAPAHTDDELRERFGGADADVVLVGHTHLPVDRRVDGMRLVNLGAVGLPIPGEDPRASYVILDADTAGCELEHRRVDYDRGAVLAALERVRYPAIDFLAPSFRA